MKAEMVEIICCPICKGDLQLYAFERKGEEIDTGALVCAQCFRFYPILDGIPDLIPEELRDTDDEVVFIKRWKDKFPKEIWEILKNKLMEKWKDELPGEIWEIVKKKVF